MKSIVGVLGAGVAECGDDDALISRHSRYTYTSLDQEVRRACSVLLGSGLAPGDRVACSIGNHADLVVAFLAAMRTGLIWVGVNTALAGPEVEYLIRDAEVAMFLGSEARVSLANDMAQRCPSLRGTIVMEPGQPVSEWSKRLAASDPAEDCEPVDPHAPAALAYTSGTTGRPKGVIHSQHNMLVPGAMSALLKPEPSGRPGVCLPLTILNLVVLGPLASFQQGLPCVLIDRTDAVGLASWIHTERVTSFYAPPTIFYDLLTNPEVQRDDLASLVRPGVGGTDCPESFRELFEKRFSRRVTSTYGLTEAPTIVTEEDPSVAHVPGSSGRAVQHLRVTIRDDEGSILPAYTPGEICVEGVKTGPFAGVYTPMLGYWRRPDATAAALNDGVLRTGDIGHLTANGDLFVTDRKNALIVRGGANVYPTEVERVMYEHPNVAGCAVIGIADERLGERVVAVVVPAEGASVTENELIEHCRTALARYKVPERIVFLDELPRNAMGKVVPAELRSQFLERRR